VDHLENLVRRISTGLDALPAPPPDPAPPHEPGAAAAATSAAPTAPGPSLGKAVGRLTTVPGIDQRTAEVVVAEIGADMNVFPTAAHLASWAGLCPGNYQSAGKRHSGRIRRGNRWLKQTLVQAAWTASRRKRGAWMMAYRRWRPRLGAKGA